MTYHDFIASKAIVNVPTGIENVPNLNPALFDFQGDITRWGLRRGRAAIFAGTGLGKTPMQCETALHVETFTRKPVLIFAPLAVASQTIAEARKILGMEIEFARTQADVKDRGVYITNYQKRQHFDPSAFGGVILDESSCLKAEDAKTRVELCEQWASVPFRYAFTATPAPNDFMEIGGHAEFLGVMSTSEMLSTFFCHDGGETQKWRLKGHAEKDFWKWMASWCVCIQHPRDLGYDDNRYDLPPMNIREVLIKSDAPGVEGVEIGETGEMFARVARELKHRRSARRSSLEDRVAAAAKIANAIDGQVAVWCNLNDEGEALAKGITGAMEVAGRHTDEEKESRMLAFSAGELRALVTKAKIAGYGMNWQNCCNVIYFADDSFESFFQLIRRFWRFGQKNIVNLWIIASESEAAVLQNLKRKEKGAMAMYRELITHMSELSKASIKAGSARTTLEYNPALEMIIPKWLKSEKQPKPTKAKCKS